MVVAKGVLWWPTVLVHGMPRLDETRPFALVRDSCLMLYRGPYVEYSTEGSVVVGMPEVAYSGIERPRRVRDSICNDSAWI